MSPGSFPSSLIASDPSIEAALKPVKLFEGIGQRGCDIGSRFAVRHVSEFQRQPSGGEWTVRSIAAARRDYGPASSSESASSRKAPTTARKRSGSSTCGMWLDSSNSSHREPTTRLWISSMIRGVASS